MSNMFQFVSLHRRQMITYMLFTLQAKTSKQIPTNLFKINKRHQNFLINAILVT